MDREKNGTPWASGKPEHRDAIETSLKASYWAGRESSEFRLSHDVNLVYSPHLRFFFPTLVIDTPHLLTYDPKTRELVETHWLVYTTVIDVGGGRLRHRTVDVVSATGVAAMIERYKASSELLLVALNKNTVKLKRIIHEQKQWWDSKASGSPDLADQDS